MKNAYVVGQAAAFLDKIVSIAGEFYFKEIARDVDLFKGKNKIGAIDLILKNGRDEFLLIEAKNHALPMDVCFNDIAKTKDQIEILAVGMGKKYKEGQIFSENIMLLISSPTIIST